MKSPKADELKGSSWIKLDKIKVKCAVDFENPPGL